MTTRPPVQLSDIKRALEKAQRSVSALEEVLGAQWIQNGETLTLSSLRAAEAAKRCLMAVRNRVEQRHPNQTLAALVHAGQTLAKEVRALQASMAAYARERSEP